MRRKTFWIATSCILAVASLLPVFSSGASPASKEKVLYSFMGGADGLAPVSDLTVDSVGNLYGTTEFGGTGCSVGCGTVFELKHSQTGWQKQVIYSFTGGSDGSDPQAGVIFDNSGNLYGTTQNTVFKLAPNAHGSWTVSIIYDLNCSESAGCGPQDDLVFDAKGNLWGTTAFGASGGGSCSDNGCGAVFELTPQTNGSWTETTLHVFTDTDGDGATPSSRVFLDSAGSVYGTTRYGGSGSCLEGNGVVGYFSGCGTVYKLTRSGGSWTETVLHNFIHGGGFGKYPSGEIFLEDASHLLGLTQAGGDGLGTLFEFEDTGKRGWHQSHAHIFFGPPDDGETPTGRLIADSHGNLLGITSYGGANGRGTVFELSRLNNGWREKVLYSFAGSPDGAIPAAGLVSDSQGVLYGTTQQGGTSTGNVCNFSGCGTVYEITP
jgi:uncharacterized repeat protein (TIGR03803 family)